MAQAIRRAEKDGSIILFDAGIVKGTIERLWQAAEQAYANGTARRGSACFFSLENRDYNLRHFRRGGLIETLLQDRYLGPGRRRNRAFDEFRLLALMYDQGLPVPQPIAARVCPCGFFYRADLLTLRIPETISLGETLTQGPLSESDWRQLGALIASFHRAGIWHADLNAGNILRDSAGYFYLIDFDRCRQRSSGSWTKRNLERLLRSCTKLKNKASGSFHFNSADWQQLLQGYAGAQTGNRSNG